MSGDGSTTIVVSTETVSETVNEDSNLNFSLTSVNIEQNVESFHLVFGIPVSNVSTNLLQKQRILRSGKGPLVYKRDCLPSF